jgi:hypothetical protein
VELSGSVHPVKIHTSDELGHIASTARCAGSGACHVPYVWGCAKM